jgi:hypothetical protein
LDQVAAHEEEGLPIGDGMMDAKRKDVSLSLRDPQELEGRLPEGIDRSIAPPVEILGVAPLPKNGVGVGRTAPFEPEDSLSQPLAEAGPAPQNVNETRFEELP